MFGFVAFRENWCGAGSPAVPVGKKIAPVRMRSGCARATAPTTVPLTSMEGLVVIGPQWSPNGRRIAFFATNGTRVMDADGGATIEPDAHRRRVGSAPRLVPQRPLDVSGIRPVRVVADLGDAGCGIFAEQPIPCARTVRERWPTRPHITGGGMKRAL